MKIFWAWQSDLNSSFSRYFIKQSIEKAIKELNKEVVFSERLELDHDTKDVPGSPSITDTIFSKIKDSTIFIGDITPIAKVERGSENKKVMNPNVAIEMGYAIAVKSDRNILTVMNLRFGTLADLPFDIRHKRGPISYELNEESNEDDYIREERKLIEAFKIQFRLYRDEINIKVSERNYDLFGQAIFFDPDEPLLRIPSDGWSQVRDRGLMYRKSKSYFYIKVIPTTNKTYSKRDLSSAIYSNSSFKINLLNTHPDNTPLPNKYGSIIYKREKDVDEVSNLVQFFYEGTIIGILNLYKDNKIYLTALRKTIRNYLAQCSVSLKDLTKAEVNTKIEIGFINGNEHTVILPKPLEMNKYYPEPERGPLELEKYTVTRVINLYNEEDVSKLIDEFLLTIVDDLGLGFEFKIEEHTWN